VQSDRRVACSTSLWPSGQLLNCGCHRFRFRGIEVGGPHWLLAFTALFSRNGSPTDAPNGTPLRSDTHLHLGSGSAGGRVPPPGLTVLVSRSRRSGAQWAIRRSGRLARLSTARRGVKQSCQCGQVIRTLCPKRVVIRHQNAPICGRRVRRACRRG